MSAAIDEILSDRITEGVVSAPAETAARLSSRWRIFAGGHPVPNEESQAAGRAALRMMKRADHERALVIFLVSGGGSAMLEAPLESHITLAELQAANDLLVTCGAKIDEVNFLRSRFSAIKWGRLAAQACSARQVTLIISDTNPGNPQSVASSPSLIPTRSVAYDASALLRDYGLERRLPVSIREMILNDARRPSISRASEASSHTNTFRVLLDQTHLIDSAARHAARLGFDVRAASDLIEQPVEEGAAELIRRLIEVRGRSAGRRVCLISAGEFRCPVRGRGRGGRNAETVLRALLHLANTEDEETAHATILSGGTDGIDGNSPAAGAVGDETTLKRARERGLDAKGFLLQSDAYTFFGNLNCTLKTGATGTNVRDLRLLLASA